MASYTLKEERMKDGTVFATVGTTKFDKFISTITEERTLNALKEKGYKNLVIQIGNGSVIPKEEIGKKVNINVSCYRFKNSIHEDILKADLVISHAGAGTCLEVLAEKKPLLVVVNEELMHNHQTELADQLSSEGYLYACTCSSLLETIEQMDLNKLKKMPPPEPNLFSTYLDKLMGFGGKVANKTL